MTATLHSNDLLGIRFDTIEADDALAALAVRPAHSPFAYVVTINADIMLRIDRSAPALKAIFANAWLSLCDSRVLQKLAKLRGYRLTVVPGSDLTQALLDRIITADTPLTIIGGTAETVAAVQSRYSLTRLFHHNPPMGFIKRPDEVAQAVAFVCANPARFVLISVGSPQQEILADRIAQTGAATGIGLCVGASIEFSAGAKQRAPMWMQRASLEWLHRLLTEPRRLWRRYLLGVLPLLGLFWRVPHNISERS
jgi:exopolysaccharide biosynthesis WecB/TagA/CpsF family protein